MEETHPYMSDRIRDLPQLDMFVSQVNETLRYDFPMSFWNCYDLFDELVQSEFVTNLINHELSCLVNDALYTISDSSQSGFFLVQTDQFSLGLAVLENASSNDQGASVLAKVALNDPDIGDKMLYGLTSHQMIGVHGNVCLELEWFIQENLYPIEIFDKSKTLTRQATAKVNSSKPRCFIAYEDVIRIIPPKAPCVVFYFMTTNIGNIRWEYDSKTLKPTRAIATSMNSSRLQWAAESLAVLGSEDSVPALEKLCTHPDHFVRWSAISNLIQLDFEKGVSLLKQASRSDDHPHIRNVAQKSLQILRSGQYDS